MLGTKYFLSMVAVLIVLSMQTSLANEKAVGLVELVVGHVYAISTTGEKRELSHNMPVYVGDTLHVDTKGNLLIMMSDSSRLGIYPDTTVNIKAFTFGENKAHAHFDFKKGTLILVYGEMIKEDIDINLPYIIADKNSETPVKSWDEAEKTWQPVNKNTSQAVVLSPLVIKDPEGKFVLLTTLEVVKEYVPPSQLQ